MKTEALEEILKAETDLAEALLGVLKEQQNAIIHFRGSALSQLIEQQHSLMRPLEQLERERQKLIDAMKNNNTEAVSHYKQRLKSIVQQILEINQQNKVLIENALKFIQYNVRLLTEGLSKQIIDAKV